MKDIEKLSDHRSTNGVDVPTLSIATVTEVFDVALIENQLIPALIKGQHLAQLNLANVSNFKNISANFRDLVILPGDGEPRKGSIIQPLSPGGKKLYADIWTRFMAGSC